MLLYIYSFSLNEQTDIESKSSFFIHFYFAFHLICIIFACKNKKNGRNFLHWHVNNCYICSNVVRQGDISKEWKVFLTTCKGQS